MSGLSETYGFAPPPGWNARIRPTEAHGGAYAAGRAYRALARLRDRFANGRIVVCSHGDVVPALLAFLCANEDVTVPELPFDRPLWTRLDFDRGTFAVRVQHRPAGFPN